jgi:hypothetical protein
VNVRSENDANEKMRVAGRMKLQKGIMLSLTDAVVQHTIATSHESHRNPPSQFLTTTLESPSQILAQL